MSLSLSRRMRRVTFAVCLVAALGAIAASSAMQPPVVRLALVNVPDEVLRPMLPDFHKQHGITASIVYTGNDPFAEARAGRADLVIAHFGHPGVEPFVMAQHGLWPKAVMSNQMALIGPASDPARVRGARSLSEAFRRIAASKATYVANASAGARYIEAIATADAASVRPTAIESGAAENAAAARLAAQRGAYVLWGVPPFLRWKRQLPIEQGTDLEPLVLDDPLLHRMMVAIAVNPKTVKGVDHSAAQQFQNYLLSPPVQARIAAFRYPDFDRQVWWPAGRHNAAHD